MRRYSGDPFRLEVLTEESFVDGVFTISVIVIRLSCTARTEWVIANDTERARSLYGIDKEEYLAMKEAQLQNAHQTSAVLSPAHRAISSQWSSLR